MAFSLITVPCRPPTREGTLTFLNCVRPTNHASSCTRSTNVVRAFDSSESTTTREPFRISRFSRRTHPPAMACSIYRAGFRRPTSSFFSLLDFRTSRLSRHLALVSSTELQTVIGIVRSWHEYYSATMLLTHLCMVPRENHAAPTNKTCPVHHHWLAELFDAALGLSRHSNPTSVYRLRDLAVVAVVHFRLRLVSLHLRSGWTRSVDYLCGLPSSSVT